MNNNQEQRWKVVWKGYWTFVFATSIEKAYTKALALKKGKPITIYSYPTYRFSNK